MGTDESGAVLSDLVFIRVIRVIRGLFGCGFAALGYSAGKFRSGSPVWNFKLI